jgi:hypothetical protein
MKKLYIFSLFIISCFAAMAQYENSWINYGQPYWKVKIAQEGIYRIPAIQFLANSIPLNGINPSKIQVFHNGVEQYIYVNDQDGNNLLNGSDYIEFYATKNDGTFDTQMYADSNWQPNPRYSLINDTAVYFLSFINPSNPATGKRLTNETDVNYSGYTAVPYFLKTNYIEEGNSYNYGDNTDNADYTEAEGWVGSPLVTDGSAAYMTTNKVLSTANIYSGGGVPATTVNTAIVGANNNPHHVQIVGSGGINTDETSMVGYEVRRYSYSLPGYSSQNISLVYRVVPQGGIVDHASFVYATVTYPHTLDLEAASSFTMYVKDNGSAAKTYLPLTDFSSAPAVCYDLTNHKRIAVTQSSSNVQVLIPNDGNSNPKQIYLSSEVNNSSNIITKIYPTNYNLSSGFTNFNLLSPQYAVDSAYIIITSSTLKSTVDNYSTDLNQATWGYKQFRNYTTNNRVRVIDVDELYDQFAYGIRHHGLAIKKFAHYILDNWTVAPPQAIFIIGKSIQPDYIRHDPVRWAQCLVASYGYPTSDNLLLTGINGAVWEPAIPVGRLSAQNSGDINLYLDKVKEYEALQNAPPLPWMKEVLHFGGGDNVAQQTTISYYLNDLKRIIEDTSYGGRVTSYFKNSPDPIIINQSDSLMAKINAGVSFMKFFGHASGSSFDISTDEPSNYRNYGKYPIVSASSCFAGNVHDIQKSVGEKFVLQPGKAAIAFLASVGLGYEFYLYRYDTTLYKNIAFKYYGQPFSRIIQQTCKQLQLASSTDIRIKQVNNEMCLQGDPALKLNNWSKPDYVAEESNVSFSPSSITTDLESFNVKFITRNWAKAVPDSFNVVINRTFPDGTDSVYTVRRSRCYYADTLTVTMQTGGVKGAGVNNFKIRVDLDPDSVNELNNIGNNQTTASVFIISNDITPIYPAKFAIHPNSMVTLKASTVNPFRPVRTYRFEIDTAYFNDNLSSHSSLYRSGNVTSAGGVISWSPSNYPLIDSVVYYWRVYDDTTTILKNESSFIYIPQKTGWSQKHFYQFKNDIYQNVQADSATRKFNFGVNLSQLLVKNKGDAAISEYYLNNVLAESGGGCTGFFHPSLASVMVSVIDSLTLLPMNNENKDHGQWNKFYDYPNTLYYTCRNRPENYFIYSLANDAASFSRLFEWIRDSVADGNYVLMYSWTTWSWQTNANTSLDSLMNYLGNTTWPPPDGVPFSYVVKKGRTSVLNTAVYGSSTPDSANLSVLLRSQWYNGHMTSPSIGPAAKWSTLHWATHTIDTISTRDDAFVRIYGLNASTNTWDTLMYNVPQYYTDSSLASINAAQYPYLKLDEFVQDDSLRTPPQTDKWQIYYDEAPECALNPARQYSFYNNPIAEGDTIKMSMAIDNIGNVPMDSLEVSWYLYDRDRVRHNLLTHKMDSLRVGQTLTANIRVDSTFNLHGNNSLWVEANPYTSNHQQEQFHFNNLAEIKFNMTRDAINPILDVAFDGIHILDGDIVSGKPQIIIQLKDENKFLAMTDTGNFRVSIKSPSENTPSRVYFSQLSWSDSLHFKSATLPDNKAQIVYSPMLTEDGVYTLQVEATDASNNLSGKYDYRITFEVINKSTITEVLNYPNPFTTLTHFVFVLTGNEVPDRMRIRIMTVSGKVVREIMKEELGNIHIGRNITEYAWDGRDEYGDRLANGVYLYQVVTDFSSGKDIEHRTSDADKYFKKGWGKMYLMR